MSFPLLCFSEFEKSYYYQYTEADFSFLQTRDVSLHHFPWAIREYARVTQKDGSYHTNQIDFVVLSSANVYASKPGVVVFKKESSNTGGCNMDYWEYANLVVVQHNASEYSWYYHLAQDSVTVEVGDSIGYGTKIGVQGNTGYACGTTGIHLHYMVSTSVPSYWPNPDNPAYAPWPPSGTIVRVDFIEASWSSLAEYSSYESQNAPPPGICGAGVSQVSFFDNPYCNGSLGQVSSPGLYELNLLGYEDQIESIEIPAGMSVGLYLDQNEAGDSICLNSTEESLWNHTFLSGDAASNRASWMRLFSASGCPLDYNYGVRFYSDTNFSGSINWGMVGERLTSSPEHVANSILIPGGYSLQIWDEDNYSGNTLCLSSSVLDMSEYAWSDTVIESLQFSQGNICEGLDPYLPVLISPIEDGYAYGVRAPELCWRIGATEPMEFSVEVTGSGNTYQSGWIPDECWDVEEIAGVFGDYSWRVQSKTVSEEISDWSASRQFAYVEDTTNPDVAIISPTAGGEVVFPRANIVVSTSDLGGVKNVHFFAWYDDGSGAGHDWHYLGVDDSDAEGWYMTWGLVDAVSPITAVWVYSEDYSGNYSSEIVQDVYISNSLTIGDGYESRGGRGDVENIVPTSFPAFPEEGKPEILEEGLPSNQEDIDEVLESESDSPVENQQTDVNENSVLPVLSLSGPEDETVIWSEESPSLCWEQMGGAESYKVKIEWDGGRLTSNWIDSTCWQPSEIAGITGVYQWQVRYRDHNGERSEWSEERIFSVGQDITVPEVSITSAYVQPGYEAGKTQLIVSTTSVDIESGVDVIFLLAFYDDGTGADWHQLDAIYAPVVDSSRLAVNLPVPVSEISEIWVYVLDWAGNIGSDRLSGDLIVSSSNLVNNSRRLEDTAYLQFRSNTNH